MADPTGRKWHDMIVGGQGAAAAIEIIVAFSQGKFPKALIYIRRTAALPLGVAGNDQGGGTGERARAGSPHSSATNGRRTPAATISTATSSSATTAKRPAGSCPTRSWRRSAAIIRGISGNGWRPTRTRPAVDVLAIAHNGNLSNGRMFPIIESVHRQARSTATMPRPRAKWERLYEATQIKGDGETHPFLSPNDEFANFERWDKGNLDLSEAKKPDMLQYEYARSG